MSLLGRGHARGGNGPPLAFRAEANAANSNVAGKPTGIAVGDLVFVLNIGGVTGVTLTTGPGAAWTRSELVPSSASHILFWKVLNATDVANTWDFNAANQYSYSVAYSANGLAVSSVNLRSSAVNAATAQSTLSLAGFAFSNGVPRSVFSALADEDADTTPVAPPGFTVRSGTALGSVKGGLADMLEGYAGGAAVWSGLNGAAHAREAGWLLEIF